MFETMNTTVAFTVPAPTATRPTTGVIPHPVNNMKFCICGAGDANDTVQARFTGWQFETLSALWIPATIMKVTGTLGTATGVAGNDILTASVRFCDLIAVAAATGMPDFVGLQQYMIFYMTTLLGTGFIFWRNV
ncbi:hypothetical protein LCGC14_2249340 [marine sediment metagenome]|uniref:Uncharacterized protein n=1 Tax=marine sediment metagenome TaxID=412755 RepID=A0A0F9FFL6_9ZZZZ